MTEPPADTCKHPLTMPDVSAMHRHFGANQLGGPKWHGNSGQGTFGPGRTGRHAHHIGTESRERQDASVGRVDEIMVTPAIGDVTTRWT